MTYLLTWALLCLAARLLGPVVLGPRFVPGFVRGHAWVWPFVAVEDLDDDRLVEHERTHHAQQCELLVAPFYAIYAGLWLWGLARHRSTSLAYWLHPMERAANALDARPYSWLRYLHPSAPENPSWPTV